MYENVLVVTAHPDDLEMGCGGTVARLVSEGANVTNLVMVPTQNYTFAETASEILGYSLVPYSNDMRERFFVNHHTVEEIENSFNVSDYDLIITHWKEDWHQDHRKTHELVNILTRRYPGDLWYMEGHPYSKSYKEFNPNIYIDVSSQYDKKLQAMDAYKNLLFADTDGINCHDIWRGSHIGSNQAEAFTLGRMVL